MYPGRRRRRSCSRKLDAFRRRLGCAVMMRRVVTRALQTTSWCRAACNRGSGRSRRVHSAASNRLVPTPIRESKASHQHKERSPWHAGNVEAHHIDRFRSKFSVVALTTGFTNQIDVVLTQKAPNIIETPRTSGANYIRRDAQVGGYPSPPQNLKSVTQ